MRWFIDGSVVDGKWPELAVATAAVVVVGDDGSLLAYAEALLPPTVLTAAAAEAHGLLLAMQCSVCTPRVVTDCQSLLTTAGEGTHRAPGADRPLARGWAMIAITLAGDLQQLIKDGKLTLVWVPAHQTMEAIGEKRLSHGRPSPWLTGEPTA